LEKSFGVSRIQTNRIAKVLNLLLGGRCRDSSNVVLECVQPDDRRGGNIGLPADGDLRVKGVQNIPCQRRLNIDELKQRAGLIHFRQQSLTAHVEQLRRGGESSSIETIGAKHHVVHV